MSVSSGTRVLALKMAEEQKCAFDLEKKAQATADPRGLRIQDDRF